MDTEIKSDTGAVQFNIGARQLNLIANLTDLAATNYLSGKLTAWYFVLRSIKIQIIARLTKKEREELKTNETEISKLINDMKEDNKGNHYPEENPSKIRRPLGDKIEEYDIRIKELLEAKGFLVPGQKDRSSVFHQDSDGTVLQDERE